jgi:lipoprotein-anchoring transpeptidase ErfK/SrfK
VRAVLRRGRLVPVALGAVLLVAARPGLAAAEVRTTPPLPVVGAGTIEVPLLDVHAAPRRDSRVVARLTEFRAHDFRPRVVLAVAAKRTATTRRVGPHRWRTTRRLAWYEITIPGRPNGRRGWVRSEEVSIRPMQWQVVVFRESRVLQLWRGARRVHQARVAVGAPGTETPLGLYHVTVRFRPVRQTFLGTYAFETSAYSALSEWPGGGVVGIHGTWQPKLLGQAVSYGCIRVANETANLLRDRIPVGTPIRVVEG